MLVSKKEVRVPPLQSPLDNVNDGQYWEQRQTQMHTTW